MSLGACANCGHEKILHGAVSQILKVAPKVQLSWYDFREGQCFGDVTVLYLNATAAYSRTVGMATPSVNCSCIEYLDPFNLLAQVIIKASKD